MINKKIRKLLISHIDLDCCSCLLVADYFKLDYDRTLCMDYKDLEKEDFDYSLITNYDEVDFADMSPDKTLLDLMIEKKIKFRVYDHHASFYQLYQDNIEEFENLKTKGLAEVHFDNNLSGGEIFFNEIKKGRRSSKIMREIVQLITVYDLFKTDDPRWETALSINRLLWSNYNWGCKEAYSPLKFSKILKILKNKVVTQEEFSYNRYELNSILSTKDKESDAFKKASSKLLIRKDEKGVPFGITRMRSKVSITAFNLLRQYSKIMDYLIIINEYKPKELKMSCRSRDFNLLQLNYTKGHKKATGCKGVDNELIEKLWNGRSMYELGYDPEFIETKEEALEPTHIIY
ncbi:MAG: hypothetical protein PF569_06415 [Candidatus Woesearchaeota archaeon]|jgi:hypothetical protein|nr:hypothetical protein [Candidatus Woesearchaeota archaeon]